MADAWWSSETLVVRLNRSLEIASLALGLLIQAPPASGQSALNGFRKEKLVAETALLLYAASAIGDASVQRHVVALSKQLLPFARNESLLTMIRARPLLALELSVAHGVLTRLGLQDEEYQSELFAILELSPRAAAERTPWKDFEAAWIENLCGLALPHRHPSGALKRTTLGMGIDALYCGRQALYNLTHALIYTTDFGNACVVVARPSAEVVDEVEAALAACLDADDFDLCAELLLAWPYLRTPWTATSRLALRVLSRVEDEVGFLPSLSVREEELKELGGPASSQRIMAEAYHTIYVMGILVAALLKHMPAPEASASADASSLQLAEALYELLPLRGPRPQWETDYRRLTDGEKAGSARFLVHVGIRRALANSDFNCVAQILLEATARGMAPDSVMGQASLLLKRMGGSRLARKATESTDAAAPMVV